MKLNMIENIYGHINSKSKTTTSGENYSNGARKKKKMFVQKM
jgi:hypothetical protein